jgi:hypothetical protein
MMASCRCRLHLRLQLHLAVARRAAAADFLPPRKGIQANSLDRQGGLSKLFFFSQLPRRSWSSAAPLVESSSSPSFVRPAEAESAAVALEFPPTSSFNDKITYLLEEVPVGSMTPVQADFAQNALEIIARDHTNQGWMAEQLLERMFLETEHRSHAGASVVYPLVPSNYTNTMSAWDTTSDFSHANADPKPSFLHTKALVDRMLQRHLEHPSLHPAPNITHYNSVLHSCASCTTKHYVEAVEVAEEIIRSLESNMQKLQESGVPADKTTNPQAVIIPDMNTYNSVIALHARAAKQHHGSAMAAENWLLRLIKLCHDGALGPGVQPSVKSFNVVIHGWRKAHDEERGADRAREILQLMLEMSQQKTLARPTVKPFLLVIHAFGQRKRPDEAAEVLALAISFFSDSEEKQQQNRNETDTTVTAARTTTVASSDLDFDRDDNDFDRDDNEDLTSCLTAAMMAWAQSALTSRLDAPERAEALLRDAYTFSYHQQQLQLSAEAATNSTSLEVFHMAPIAQTHNVLLNMYIQLDRVSAADQHLRNMISAFKKDRGPAPNSKSFLIVLHGWAKRSTRPDASARADDMLRLMVLLNRKLRQKQAKTSYFSSPTNCTPTTNAFLTVVDLCCRQPRSPEVVHRTLSLLKIAEQCRLASKKVYIRVIHFLTREPSTAHDAVEVLNRLEASVPAGATTMQPHAWLDVYGRVVTVVARVGSVDSAELALKLLQRMTQKDPPPPYRINGVAPSVKAAHSVKAAPSVKAYGTVLLAFCKLIPVQPERAADVAAQLYMEMKQKDADANDAFNLDLVLLRDTLKCLAGPKGDKVAADTACQVLTDMIQLVKTQGRVELEPDAECLDAFLTALVEVGDVEYTKRAVQLLDVFVERHLESPTTTPALPSKKTFVALGERCTQAQLIHEEARVEGLFKRTHASRIRMEEAKRRRCTSMPKTTRGSQS